MKISFVKYQGAGNDFILIDFRSLALPANLPYFARLFCDRRYGIGADGLILLFDSETADFKMRIFNADGSEPSMCGNGIRCLYDFIQKQSPLKIETSSGLLDCCRRGEEIAVNLGIPRIVHWPIEIDQREVFILDTGVPHAVVFVDDLNDMDVDKMGASIRFNSQFSPSGVNVNFAAIDGENRLCVRTYERGVEAETLACGTGSAAAAFVSMKEKGLISPVNIFTRQDFEKKQYHSRLRFHLHDDAIEMLGSVQRVFEGSVTLENLQT